MPSELGRALGRGKKKGLTHKEVMHKRHLKRKKKEKKNIMTKKMAALKEYQRLSKIEYSSKKTTAMNLMELVEDVKGRIPDGTYLKMMDELMALNKEKETLSPIPRVHGSGQFEDGSDEDYIMDYFRDRYFYDRQGDRGPIYNEMNNINENTIIIDRPHNTLTTINDPIEPRANNIVSQLSNTISRVNREDTTIRRTWRVSGQHWEIQRDVQSYLNR
jgi:hypothetical protein